VQLCIDNTDKLFKIYEREPLNRNYMGFGINIAGEYIEIYGLVHKKDIKYYFLVSRVKIPFYKKSVKEVEEFIHTLMILQVRFFYSY